MISLINVAYDVVKECRQSEALSAMQLFFTDCQNMTAAVFKLQDQRYSGSRVGGDHLDLSEYSFGELGRAYPVARLFGCVNLSYAGNRAKGGKVWCLCLTQIAWNTRTRLVQRQ